MPFKVESLAEEMIEANDPEGAADWAPLLGRLRWVGGLRCRRRSLYAIAASF